MENLLRICFYSLTSLAFILIGINIYKITDCFVDIKENKIIRVIAFLAFPIVAMVVIYVGDVENVIYALIGYIAVMLICYKGSIIKRISVVMVLYPIIVSFNFIVNNIKFLTQGCFTSRINYMIVSYISVLFWYLMYRFMKDKILYAKEYINDSVWILIDIICAAPLISIVATIILSEYNEQYKAYIISLVCIISNIGIISIINYIIKSVKISFENQNYKLQYDYYKSLEEKQLEVRKIYHDMNNHLQVVANYINSNDIDKAKMYFQDLTTKTSFYRNKVFCKNSIVNAVLNNKYDVAVQNEIDCKINISIKDLLSIDDMDLCTIFANSFDNAIEASLKIENIKNRKITVKARIDKGYFSYSIINNKLGDILKLNGNILSSKNDKKCHGFGLKNIKGIVDKYDGTFNVSYTEHEFTLIIIIKL
ncbi:GHKL domain-containing protein [Clostridium cavendishii DSM 21758]|uniref:GHKL domain-containing protein n=1 Tax=Clostridium cavendishii DSM 21758 TaxID=1121302 RepID=A0A1M6MJ49_9CLOT|nr:ATP-binding protein [Clostridium cavendishii]SHJ83502.1 GHKL domain-containing protein [Clostridium cavendishii DSM 21758]